VYTITHAVAYKAHVCEYIYDRMWLYMCPHVRPHVSTCVSPGKFVTFHVKHMILDVFPRRVRQRRHQANAATCSVDKLVVVVWFFHDINSARESLHTMCLWPRRTRSLKFIPAHSLGTLETLRSILTSAYCCFGMGYF